ncbi:MAG: WD40 repeat domain-containing protein [Acidobacteria bacterium]|nr:WD40 repeat domain-containing protein [Acidobacteriota bacterium]
MKFFISTLYILCFSLQLTGGNLFNPNIPTALAMSPDGTMAAVAFSPQNYKSSRLRKLRKGASLESIDKTGRIALYATGESDGEWSSMYTGEINNPAGTGIISLAFPDRDRIAWKAIDGSITLYDMEHGTRQLFHTRDIRGNRSLYTTQAFALTPDGNRLITPDGGNGIVIFDTHTGKEHLHKGCDKRRIVTVAIAPTGQIAAVSTDKGSISVWKLPDWTPLFQFQSKTTLMQRFCSLSFSRNGQILAASYGKGTLLLMDMKNGSVLVKKRIVLFSAGLKEMTVAFSPTTDNYLICQFEDDDGSLFKILDLSKGKTGKTVQRSRGVLTSNNFAVTPDGRYVVMAAWGRHVLGDASKTIARSMDQVDLYFIRIKAFCKVQKDTIK